MKILSIVGARPQFIKLGPLSKKIRGIFEEIIIHTGQHFDEEMSKYIFDDLKIPEPNYNLEISGGLHGEQTGRMLIELERRIIKEKPDIILIFGDTNSTLAGALAGVKLGIKTIHIEAGLRSFNRTMPEEINRITTDHISDYLFAPTKTAMINLQNEDLIKKSFLTGDIMTDALKDALQIADLNSNITEILHLSKEDYYLLTLHRPYNVDDPVLLKKILMRLKNLDKVVIFPVHPRTRIIIEKNKINIESNIRFCKPLGYFDFLKLQKNSYKIITDSGGIQKEAYILCKPCITLRPETEWVETVEAGWNLLITPESDFNEEEIRNFYPPKDHPDLFGHNVADKMVNIITNELS